MMQGENNCTYLIAASLCISVVTFAKDHQIPPEHQEKVKKLVSQTDEFTQ